MKYKLIKGFPSSPIVGTIVELVKDRYIGEQCDLSRGYVDCYPEFWETIEELDYEILSIFREDCGILFKDNQGRFQHVCNRGGGFALSLEHALFKEFTIHSVKRVKDSLVFSVNDEVIYKFGSKIKKIIVGITFKEDKIWLQTDLENLGYSMSMEHAEKDEVIFISDDNIEVKKGDIFYAVCNTNFNITKTVAPHFTNNPAKYKRFVNEEKAKEYRIFNKVCLSLHDVQNNLDLHQNLKVADLIKVIKRKLRL